MAVARSNNDAKPTLIEFPASPTARERIDAVIALVDEWMKDESGYDEMAWPILAKSLNENRLSARERVRE